MKSPVFLTDTQKSEMAEMYKNGLSIRACAKHFQVDTSTAHKWLRVAGVQLRDAQIARRVYACNEHTFDQSDPEHAYWFGFLLADGCIFQRAYGSTGLSIALAEKDREHLEKLRQFLRAEHPIRQEPKTHSVRLTILSNPLCESLIKRGCTPRKSLELEYPAYGYFYRRHFIRGYFDGV